jgi:hypothetical protein
VLVSTVLAAGSALADSSDYLNGTAGSPDPISTAEAIAIFVGIPVLLMIIFAALTIPQRSVGAVQYRPGRPWGYGPEWFGAKPEGDHPRAAVPGSGGASARW